MALIASAAYKNDTLLTISKDKSYRLPATKNNPDGVTIQPEHKLLITTDTESPNYYPYAVAGKTGYTSIAGQTLVDVYKRQCMDNPGRNPDSAVPESIFTGIKGAGTELPDGER